MIINLESLDIGDNIEYIHVETFVDPFEGGEAEILLDYIGWIYK